jgi:DNA-binding winged helix-turn-helix (wHTH) protein
VIYSFEDCEVDLRRCELRRGGKAHHVEPQVFDLLAYLVRHRDRLVTKEELLDRIWGHRFVTPGALNARVKALRQAIGDDGRAQQLVRTIRRRGFRFIAPVTIYGEGSDASEVAGSAGEAGAEPVPSSANAALPLIARSPELRRLRELLLGACGGRRQIAFLVADAGIGKTTLLDAFLARVTSRELRIGRGQCLEQRGGGEPYLPILEALGRLCRGRDGPAVVSLLVRCAPTWLLQMPAYLSAEQHEDLRRRAFDATRERMLREMVEALEALAGEMPLLLVLEDVHWSDPSTLDLLLWIGQRSEAARLLIVATYRPVEARSTLDGVVEKLSRGQGCAVLELPAWTDAEITEYLVVRFLTRDFPPSLSRLIHARTAGNPLFVQSLVDDWIRRGKLAQREHGWSLTGELDDLASDIPSTLRDSLRRQVERLGPADRAVLEAASVAGPAFTGAAIAAALDVSEEEIEACCIVLAQESGLVKEAGETQWPDGTYTARFAFRHDLYREVIYGRVPVTRRAQLHRRIGRRLEAGYRERMPEHVGELALHFVRGRDDERALVYLERAARLALQRNAHREAVGHLRTALEILARNPDLPEGPRVELALLQMLGPSLLETRGWRDPESERAYMRARAGRAAARSGPARQRALRPGLSPRGSRGVSALAGHPRGAAAALGRSPEPARAPGGPRPPLMLAVEPG